MSDFDAVLLGLGGQYRVGSFQGFAEWTWDVLVGGGAPSVGDSPMRVGLGGRLWVLDQDALQLEAKLEVLASGRGAVMSPNLSPVEPRVSFSLGATIRFPSPELPVVEPDPDDVEDDPRDVTVAVGVVRGRLIDEAGQPVAGAEVLVRVAGGESVGPVTSSVDGDYIISEVSVGTHELVVTAPDYREAVETVTVTEGGVAEAPVTVNRDLPSGQIRGVVQSFRGDPVAATIRVEPLGTEVQADAEGIFQVDVPPGAYTVTVTAEGFAEQSRPLLVEQGGVTILNVDLRGN